MIEIDVESGHAVLKPCKLIDPLQGWYIPPENRTAC